MCVWMFFVTYVQVVSTSGQLQKAFATLLHLFDLLKRYDKMDSKDGIE